MPPEDLPDGPHACVSPFFSPLQQRTLPPAVVALARAEGLSLPANTAAGFSPGTFAFPAPDGPQFGLVVDDATWPRGQPLRVHFLNGSADLKNAVETFARAWSEVAEVDFEFGAPRSQSDVRITFRQPGFYSLLGMEARQAANETMSLGFRGTESDDDRRRLILHEFGHALGLMHEHQHPEAGIEWDEAGAVGYYGPRLPGLSPAQIMAQLRAVPAASLRYKFFRFDPASIMMYFIPEVAVRRGFYDPERFGRNNTTLSESDAVVMGSVYGPRGGGPGGTARRLTVDGTPLADSIDRDGEVDLYYFTAPALGRYQISVVGDALVHVDITDEAGNPPFPGDRGGDSASRLEGLKMMRLLDRGRQNVRLTGSRFATGFSSGQYTIRVTRVSSP